jgi:hypothetical protein
MGEFKRKIVLFLFRLFPQKAIQYNKEEFSEINDEHKLLKGVKGSDKIKVALHLERKL